MEVHRGPTADGWSSVTRHGKGETLTLVDFPDVKVRVSDVVR
jgi:hypothetical protein